MKDIDIIAAMFEEIKKHLEKMSKQEPASKSVIDAIPEEIAGFKKILKLIFETQIKLYESQRELPKLLKQTITIKVKQPPLFWWLVLTGFLLSCSISLNFYQWLA